MKFNIGKEDTYEIDDYWIVYILSQSGWLQNAFALECWCDLSD